MVLHPSFSPFKKEVIRNDKGFTLVELLAVLIIIAILAAISAPIYMNYVKGARAADAQTTLSAILTAQKVHYQKTGEYATNIEELEDPKNPEITIDQSTKNNWTFTIQASRDNMTEIIATSTENMPGGSGKIVRYIVKDGKYEGYGLTE